MSEKRQMIALRIDPDQLRTVDHLAKVAGMSRNEYMIRASLGEITNPTDADSRLASLEERFERLEERVYQYN